MIMLTGTYFGVALITWELIRLRFVAQLKPSVSACIRLNGICLDWYNINVGLSHGCLLSPILSLYR